MKKTKRGYIIIYKPNHPFAQRGGWLLKHRFVMEQKMGRFLQKEEVIHHIDGNKENNEINNLMLFENHAEHIKYHALDNKWINRIRMQSTGRRHTDESKKKISLAKMGNKVCVGRIMSLETRRKISESNRRTKGIRKEQYATH